MHHRHQETDGKGDAVRQKDKSCLKDRQNKCKKKKKAKRWKKLRTKLSKGA